MVWWDAQRAPGDAANDTVVCEEGTGLDGGKLTNGRLPGVSLSVWNNEKAKIMVGAALAAAIVAKGLWHAIPAAVTGGEVAQDLSSPLPPHFQGPAEQQQVRSKRTRCLDNSNLR